MMKSSAIVFVACVLLFALNVPRVESARPHGLGAGHHHGHGKRGGNGGGHGGSQHDQPLPGVGRTGYSFYVFGDSFADNGNLVKQSRNSSLTRQWYPPYLGTGRFSPLQVESDFIAAIIGQPSSPPAHRQTRGVSRAGMNFAVGGSGVLDAPGGHTLSRQVHAFNKLVNDGAIKREWLDVRSVALVAVDGNDYARVGVETSSYEDVRELVEKVTDEIVANVERLHQIGVMKILVNTLFPLGCAPSQTRQFRYGFCDEQANLGAEIHNQRLLYKLNSMSANTAADTLVLSLDDAFRHIVGPEPDVEMVNLFPNRFEPCCEAMDPNGYCGQVDTETGEPLYTVCVNPDSYLFWDDMNPTQVGWEAIMAPFDRHIRQFLELRP